MSTTVANKITVDNPVSVSEEEFMEHQENSDGLCIACGEWTSDGHVEPDASGYHCGECGKNEVIGAEDALVCGYVDIGEG